MSREVRAATMAGRGLMAISVLVRATVYERDAQSCVWCGRRIYDEWASLQHRRSRSMGGSRQADTNLPANLLLVDGTGTTGCHGRIESAPELARHYGYRINQTDDPTTVPVWIARLGWVLLDNFGGYVEVPDPDPSKTAMLQRISDVLLEATS